MLTVPAYIVVVNSMVANAILAVIFFSLWKIDKRERPFAIWGMAYVASSLVLATRLFDIDPNSIATQSESFVGAVVVVLIWIGAREFVGAPLKMPWTVGLCVLGLLWSAGALSAGGLFPNYVSRVLGGFIFLLSAIAMLRHGREVRGAGYRLVGWLIGLYAVLGMFSPFIVESIADEKANIVGPLFNVTLGMLLLVVTQLKQQRALAQANEELRQEVVARELAESEGSKNGERYRAILNSTRSLIGLLSPDGKVLDANRISLEHSIHGPSKIIGQHFWDTDWWRSDPEQQKRLKEAIRRVSAGGNDHFVAKALLPDGTFGYFNFFLTPIRDGAGKVIYLVPEAHDITERKNMEETLYVAEQRFRAISESSVVGIFACKPSGELIYVSRRACEIVGVSQTQALTGHWIDNIHPADRIQLEDDVERAIIEQRPMSRERRYIINEKLVWTSTNLAPIIEHEKLHGFVGTIEDITARKHAEHALRDSQKKFISFFGMTPESLAVADPEGNYIEVNDAWMRTFGYGPNEVLGKSNTDLKFWQDTAEGDKLFRELLLSGEVRNQEMGVRHKTGDEIVVLVSAQIIQMELSKLILWNMRDITAQRRIEKSLQGSEERFSAFFHMSPVALGVTSIPDAHYIDVNEAWVSQFGYVREEIIGKTSLEIGLWADVEERARLLDEVSKNGVMEKREVRFLRADGTEMLCELSNHLFDFNGQSVLVWSAHDVTERRRVEREVQDLNAQLEARVGERTVSLKLANSELAGALDSLKLTQEELIRTEKLAALGSLVAGVAHELNTPIGNSMTVASTLSEKTREFSHEVESGKVRRSTLGDYLTDAKTATELLMRSLAQANELVSSFKQVAVDQTSAQRRDFDLKLVLEEIATTLTPTLKKKPFKFVLDVADNLLMQSFPGSLGQVVTNFVANSLAHGFEDRDEGSMWLSAKLIGNEEIELVYSDDGIGIPEADLNRVFDPFFTTKLGRGGSGLGLHIVYNIVTRILGGKIQVSSSKESGTRFVLTLPLVAPENGGRASFT